MFHEIRSRFQAGGREALRGKWVLAILAGVVAMLLGGTLSNGPQVNFSYSGGDLSANLQYAGQNIYAWGNGITPACGHFSWAAQSISFWLRWFWPFSISFWAA